MKIFFIFLALVSTTGCAIYRYQNDNCTLSIYSMREVKAGDIRISKTCAVTGGAEGMSYNEQQLQIMQKIVDKIP